MIAILSLALLMAETPGTGMSISGVGRAIDGDSLRVGQWEVRLLGIDAPELSQTCERGGQSWKCGTSSAQQLAKLVDGQQVECVSLGEDVHGRTVARCTVGNTDVNRVMVATGYALAYRRYSMDYVSAEDSAKAAKRGIWAGTFKLPSDVRHPGDHDYVAQQVNREGRHPREMPVVSSPRSRAQPKGNCRIKGNHSRRGELIYHLPGMPYYAETVAEEMFCSEADARAAGYRRSRADRR